MNKLSEIAEAVAEEFEVTVEDLKGPGKPRPLARARQAAYLLSREIAEKSSIQIGHYFRRDHSSVLVGAGRAVEIAAAEPDYAASLDQIRRVLAPPMFTRRPIEFTTSRKAAS